MNFYDPGSLKATTGDLRPGTRGTGPTDCLVPFTVTSLAATAAAAAASHEMAVDHIWLVPDIKWVTQNSLLLYTESCRGRIMYKVNWTQAWRGSCLWVGTTNIDQHGRFEVLTAVTMKNSVFCDIKPSSSLTGGTLGLRYRVQPVNAMSDLRFSRQ
jgi:hypothetical protein